jgi:hypothetical protein
MREGFSGTPLLWVPGISNVRETEVTKDLSADPVDMAQWALLQSMIEKYVGELGANASAYQAWSAATRAARSSTEH